MRFVLFLMGLLAGNMITSHFYSKWLSPEQIAFDLSQAHYTGCLKYGLMRNGTKEVIQSCSENSKKYYDNTRTILKILM